MSLLVNWDQRIIEEGPMGIEPTNLASLPLWIATEPRSSDTCWRRYQKNLGITDFKSYSTHHFSQKLVIFLFLHQWQHLGFSGRSGGWKGAAPLKRAQWTWLRQYYIRKAFCCHTLKNSQRTANRKTFIAFRTTSTLFVNPRKCLSAFVLFSHSSGNEDINAFL